VRKEDRERDELGRKGYGLVFISSDLFTFVPLHHLHQLRQVSQRLRGRRICNKVCVIFVSDVIEEG
jgi:hypothetical protein